MKPLSASSLKKSIFSKLFFVFAMMFSASQLHAAINITGVTVGNNNFVPAATIPNILFNATISSGGACSPTYGSNQWCSTAYMIDNDPNQCYGINTDPDYGLGTYTNIQPYTAGQVGDFLNALPPGTHNVTFIASGAWGGGYSTNACKDRIPGESNYTVEVTREPSLIINNVSINGGSNIVTTGSISSNIAINATIKRGTWSSTAYIINGTCYNVDTANHGTSNPSYVNTFSTGANSQSADFVNRLPMGKSNVTFIASTSSNQPCTQANTTDESLPFTIEVEKRGLFNCDTLYMVTDDGGLFSFNDPTQNGNVGSVLMDLGGDDTIALGPWGNESGTLTLHHWGYFEDRTIQYIGDTIGSYTILGSTSNTGGSWSGGEANQMSGEVYFSSAEGHRIESNFRYGVYNTATGTFKRSGVLSPATPSDTLTGYVSSDMAIDAKGNMYSFVYQEGSHIHDLIRVVVGENGGNWKYNRVKRITGVDHTATSNDMWGVAFFNGKLYAGSWRLYEIDPLTGAATLKGETITPESSYLNYFLDLTSCQVAAVAEGKVYYDADGDGFLSDSEKNAPGVANVSVDIHDAGGTKIGGVVTSGDGSYSLLLPSTKTTFYIRLNQPYVNGTNAHQTWASGGRYSWTGTYAAGNNTVTPKCYNDPTLSNKTSVVLNQQGVYAQNIYDKYGIACDGAKSNGIDPSGNININNANYYSIINITTDRAVIEADFALGPVDRGDAPASYGDASHSMAGSNSKIGDKTDADDVSRASANAQGDDTSGTAPDDEEGVQITIPSDDGLTTQTLLLDDALLRNNSTIKLYTRVPYTFTVKVTQGGYLSAWTHINKASGTTGSFTERMHNATEIQDGGAGDEDGVVNGRIVFTYTIPRTVSLAGKQNIFFRFRYASTANATEGFNAAREKPWWNTHPWVTTGEVEDYGVWYDASATPFYCSILYATTLNGTIYGFTNPAVSTSFIEDDYLFWFNSTKHGNTGSIAIGKYVDKIAMFAWSYTDNISMKVVKSGESDIANLTNPRPLLSNTGAARYWSGGVRHPQDGSMYLSGYVNTTIHASPYAQILTYDSSGGQLSGNLTPALAGAEIRGRLASDAFLGADGHIYTLGVEGGNYYLFHINPDNWQYSKGAAVNGLDINKWIYGLAFLNGKIYATTNSSEFYEIDPTTGNAKQISGSIKYNSYYDLASCQVAPILSGTLYFDKNADGVLSTGEKSGKRLSNVTVELYDQNKVYLSSSVTNTNGEYSFMLNNLGDTAPFYIRVKQPHIGEYKAVQTWASGSDTSISSVYGVCDNANHTADGECYGANGPLFEDGGGSDLANANYYSILIVKDSSVPSVVDFGFSGVDRSDAPSRYGEARHSAIQKIINLGGSLDADLISLAGEDANNDTYDNGVQVKPEGGSYVNLQGATLEANTTYIFKVALGGNMSSEGQLRAWISLSNVSGKLDNYSLPIFTQSNISDSFVEFNYTVPMSMFGDEYVYLRFRFALGNTTQRDSNATLSSGSSNLTFGEVEDYRVLVKNNNPRDLEEIYNMDLYGDVRIIGNTVMARANTTGFTPMCPANNENNDANNKTNTVYWNVDNLTSSSSSAYLDIPNGAEVKAAFLRWQGANIRNMPNFNQAKTVTVIDALGSSHAITAEIMNWYNHAYQGTANITNIVKNAGAGNYSVGDIFTSFDKNSYGAWAIIVVYNNENDNNEVLRKAVVYDGFVPVGVQDAGFSVTGFRTSSIGSVESKMYLFAGEGDIGGNGGDSVKLNNKDIGGSDPINGRITYFGNNVLDRNASCINNLAADIHTYNVGINAIGNGITEANVELSSGSDIYHVGLVGLSIQLYEPRVCYYVDSVIGSDGSTLFENGTFGGNIFSENQNYTFNLFIANMQDGDNSSERDVAYNVQAHMTYLKPEQLNYTLETTKIANVGSSYESITDAPADDLGEYENYRHTWRVGHSADSSKGGSLDVSYDLNTAEKSLIELGMYLGRLDANASEEGVNLVKYLRFQASYNSGVSNTTRIKDIAQCRPMDLTASTDPKIGSFNVVNENLPDNTKEIDTNADHEDNALYTQIAGKPFDVKLIALEEPDSSNPSKLKLVDYNTNRTVFKLELINGENYDTCSNGENDQKVIETCCQSEPEIGQSDAEGLFSQDNNTIGIKRIHLTSNATVEYGKFRVVWYKTIGNNEMRYSCSADRFAIRPDRFEVGNVTGKNLIGGADNNATLSAYNYGSPSVLSAYNRTTSALSHNATLEYSSLPNCNASEIDIDINDANFNASHSSFMAGQADLSIWYNNVGNMSAVVIDSNYTHVDQKKYGGGEKDDCIADNATNIETPRHKIGCNIASNNTGMRFVPNDFRVEVDVINANSGNFTYLSNNESMAAEVTTELTARLGISPVHAPGVTNPIVARNYHKGCFAKDVTYKFDIENNNFTDYNTSVRNDPDERAIFFEKGAKKATLENNNNASDGTGEFKVKEDQFGNGVVSSIEFGFNFNRSISTGENPFILHVSEDINITDSAVYDDDTHVTNATVTDANITFLYGRVFIKDQTGPSSITVPVKYELYCVGLCNKISYGVLLSEVSDEGGSEWFFNDWHSNGDYGDVTNYNPQGAANMTSKTSPVTGAGDVTFGNNAGYTPYQDTIHATPNDWLIYNKYNPNADHIEFVIKFIGGEGGWAGRGNTNASVGGGGGGVDQNTGVKLEVSPGNRTRTKADW
jgi:hypothetical protein